MQDKMLNPADDFATTQVVTEKKLAIKKSTLSISGLNFSYTVSKNSNVTINIYDIKGQFIDQLINNRSVTAGTHNIRWGGGSKFSTGIYICRMQVNSNRDIISKKVLLIN